MKTWLITTVLLSLMWLLYSIGFYSDPWMILPFLMLVFVTLFHTASTIVFGGIKLAEFYDNLKYRKWRKY